MEWKLVRNKVTHIPSHLIFILVLLVYGPFQTYASGAWSTQKSGTMSWLRSVYFLNEMQGWAVGGYGTLLTTTNGGLTWQRQKRPTVDLLRDIYFSDAKLGWIVCERNFYLLKTKDEQRSYLLKTIDGGATWARINVVSKDVDARLVRVIFADKDNGWVFGEEGVLYITNNGGLTWTKKAVPKPYLLLGGTLLDKDTGWLVGAGRTLLQTTDGGMSWKDHLITIPGDRLNSIYFFNTKYGWAVGSSGTIIHTSNGGRTWKPQTSSTTSDLLDVKFINEKEGWIVGGQGAILHTVDGGEHWSTVPSDTKHLLERACFVNKNYGWAVGFGGTIISYTSSSSVLTNRSSNK
jgi:photosystem II stability/assembly factor-like uncharacterized protein